MAPSIPTHRPLLTATRVAVAIAMTASASSLYVTFGTAWAGTGAAASTTVAQCPAAPSVQQRAQAGVGEPERAAQ